MGSKTDSKPTRLERLLRIFTEVRAGEGATALLMTVNIFFIATCYYILKPAREAFLSLDPDGARVASYAAAAMAVILIPFVWAYGHVGRRVDRRKLIAGVTAFFIANLIVFYFLARTGVPWLGAVFFIWLGIFNLSVIAQFWAYGNDIYSQDQGKRLFPMILLGQNAGAILGPLIAKKAVETSGGTASMLLVAGAVLSVCIFLTLKIESTHRPGRISEKSIEAAPLGREGGFELIWKHRYLLYIALLIMILNLVNTTGEYILRSAVYSEARAHEQPDVYAASFYSNFFLGVNTLGLLLQALVVSRVIKVIGVRGALLIPAVMAFLGYGLVAFVPLLMVITVYKTLENATDYTLMNTLRAALYLPTTREMKYKAKQAIDTFFVRLGDVLSAGVVAAGTYLGLAVGSFAAVVVAVAGGWLVLVHQIRKEYGRISEEEVGDEAVERAVAAENP